ncbi:N-terminal domain of NEFA-interacting nuclear protein NIP30-domain-containing protein [Xylariaceae sp. FL1272]|nr:N-terminal domain of NEFA-interacting nuclear protein NIP30-domain-containing protein [Xylariaceae sp. FL1272]
MTSRFVSGGTIAGQGDGDEARTQTSLDDASGSKGVSETRNDSEKTTKNVEWERVQRELEDERKKRADARRANVEGGGEKSLFDILQANKAAKQAAFEEANKIKNQFRSLDDDEIEFLDEVQSKKRAEEERARREVEDGIAKFREAQKGSGGELADARNDEGEEGVGDVEWIGAGGRKRKREREKGFKGLKRRASAEGGKEDGDKSEVREKGGKLGEEKTKEPEPAILATKTKPALGLVDYGSDEDDDD